MSNFQDRVLEVVDPELRDIRQMFLTSEASTDPRVEELLEKVAAIIPLTQGIKDEVTRIEKRQVNLIIKNDKDDKDDDDPVKRLIDTLLNNGVDLVDVLTKTNDAVSLILDAINTAGSIANLVSDQLLRSQLSQCCESMSENMKRVNENINETREQLSDVQDSVVEIKNTTDTSATQLRNIREDQLRQLYDGEETPTTNKDLKDRIDEKSDEIKSEIDSSEEEVKSKVEETDELIRDSSERIEGGIANANEAIAALDPKRSSNQLLDVTKRLAAIQSSIDSIRRLL
jgi:chromosome segregation ATPase